MRLYLARVRHAGADAVLAALTGDACDDELAPPEELRRPELLGEVYEALLDRDERRRRGAFYTPADLATAVADATLTPLLDAGADPDTVRVCDPAVGGGALLLAAARLLIARGGRAPTVVGNMTGVDLDPVAAGLARHALALLGGDAAVVVGDGLATVPGAPFDAVVTNPPFLAQLRSATARTRAEAAALSDRFGDVGRGYADTASLFLARSVALVRDGGMVGIVLPEPVLATRDGLAARRLVGGSATLARCWAVPAGVFDAGVRATVLVLARAGGGAGGPWGAGDWSALAGQTGATPDVALRTCGTVASMATVTADFRDQFYGAAAAVEDGAEAGAPLITSGLIDPARLRWGEKPARILRRSLAHPSVRTERLAPGLQRWAAGRLVPKLLVATQTRVLEAVADPGGTLLPMVPVISVVPVDAPSLWHLLAVLLAPPVSAFARRAHAGAALSADAIKLSARQVAALPLPAGREAWDEGATAARSASEAGSAEGWRAALTRMGAAMCDAYGVGDGAVLAWWEGRLPR